MSIRSFAVVCAAAAMLIGSAGALAQQRLLCSQERHGFGFGYGDYRYDNFTVEIDRWFSAVDIAPNLEDYAQMLQYDAIMVQIREWNAVLTLTEKTNLTQYIATGRRVLMIGENPSLWYSWNNDLCTVAGGSSTNQESNGVYNVANQVPILTDGVTSIEIPNGGIASGGLNIFTTNTATLWSGNGTDNVLSMLDVNVFEDDRWNTLDGGVFAANVAQWLGSGGGGGGVGLSIRGQCPGTITLAWSNATPSRPLAIAFANNTGSFVLPQGPCGGTQLGLGTDNLRLVNTINTGSGSGQVNGQVGTGACGGYVQLIVVESPCTTSNVAQIP
ncbi:MAG: hypothetical protein IT430_07760 [Phycisphaerales bacterium]|nr:hypothetical protein [Phycisphaerales bacterium]